MYRSDWGRFLAIELFLGVFIVAVAGACDRPQPHQPNATVSASACSKPGHWIVPGSAEPIGHSELIERLAHRPVVLLGEIHDNAEHHRWQLHTIAALYALNPNMILGFEMFPRRLQPVLDRWVQGELNTDAFLKQVDWSQIWGFDKALYLPLFHFARQHRIPMIALNVERSLVSRVGREGWRAVPPTDREGLSDPAPPPIAYRQNLARIFTSPSHSATPTKNSVYPHPSTDQGHSGVLDDPAYGRFVEAQLTWDRAMAEAIAHARGSAGRPLVVGIIGRGHLDHRWGVPHQLEDLGIENTAVLLPMAPMDECGQLTAGLADAVFIVPPAERAAKPRPKLGVIVETSAGGARVREVRPNSVAETARIETGDLIVEAAGHPVQTSGDLIRTIARQAPGTWLPLKIERDGKAIEIVARFPAAEPATQ